MTADESGLPPLDPDELRVPEFQPAGAIVGWVIETLLEMDIPDERRQALREVFTKISFQDIAQELTKEMLAEALNEKEIIDPDYEEPSPEDLQARLERIQRRQKNHDDEGEPTE